MQLTYVTSNQGKIQVAQRYLKPLGISVERIHLDLEEIQSHDGAEIVKRKAHQAYETLKRPLIVSDHFWKIEALNGFPGAYMKYMNEWLTPEDFLNLMKPYDNRTVYLEEYLYYIDEKEEKLFHEQILGTLLREAQGKGRVASQSVISLRDDGMSIAACWQQGINPVETYDIWDELAQFLKKQETTKQTMAN